MEDVESARTKLGEVLSEVVESGQELRGGLVLAKGRAVLLELVEQLRSVFLPRSIVLEELLGTVVQFVGLAARALAGDIAPDETKAKRIQALGTDGKLRIQTVQSNSLVVEETFKVSADVVSELSEALVALDVVDNLAGGVEQRVEALATGQGLDEVAEGSKSFVDVVIGLDVGLRDRKRELG